MHWLARLSNGEVVKETWIENELSPWQRLMRQCENDKLYVVEMALVTKLGLAKATPKNAAGYWHARAMHAIQGFDSFQYPGVGWVEDGMLHIIWGTEECFWGEHRPLREEQIIWSHGR